MSTTSEIIPSQRLAAESQHSQSSAETKAKLFKLSLRWSPEAEKAVKDLGSGSSDNLLIIGINLETFTLKVVGTANVKPSTLAAALPKDDASYSIYMWQPKKPILVYTCPSVTKIKMRMLSSSGITFVMLQCQEMLGTEIVRRIETGDPGVLDLSFFRQVEAWRYEL